MPQSFTYLATLRLSPLVPFSKLLFVICLFPFNLSCFFPSPTISDLHFSPPPSPPNSFHKPCIVLVIKHQRHWGP